MTDPSDPAVDAPAPVARLVAAGQLRLWGMTGEERLRRMLAQIGVTEVERWSGGAEADRPHLLVRADHVFAPVLLSDLLRRPGTVLTSGGCPVAACVSADRAADAASDLLQGRLAEAADLDALEPEELSSPYNRKLRKRETPFVARLTPEGLDRAEAITFAGSYKGVTDFITRHVWPRPARAVTRWCAEAGVKPNTVTAVSLVLVLLAMWLFWEGHFLPGLVAAWVMTFLDTVDGKLARVTLTSSRFGNIFDHGIDLIHPPFWYWAWAVGVESQMAPSPMLELALLVTLIGYVLERVQEGVFIRVFGLQMHVWRRFDSLFRMVLARRNPNLLLLSVAALAGRPDLGLMAVAIWTATAVLVHFVQIAQAAMTRRPLTSWLDG